MTWQSHGPAPDDVTYGTSNGALEVTSRDTVGATPQQRTRHDIRQTITTPSKPAPRKQQGAGIIIPSRGWPKTEYTLYRDADSPLPTDLTHAQWREEIIKDLEHYIGMGVRPVISLSNIKSGTKTRTATNMAAMLSRFGGLRVLVMPATMNSATASLAQMVGFEDGEVITLDDLVIRRNEFKRYFALTSQIKKFTIDHFQVVSEGVNDARRQEPLWNVANWVEALRIVRSHYDVIILDHANDDILAGSIGLAAVRMSDVVILPQNGKDSLTKKSLKRTFDGYKTDPFQGLTVEQIVKSELVGMYENQPDKLMLLPGELIPTWDKIKSAIVVTSRSTPKEWPIEKVKQLLRGPGDNDGQSSRTYEWVGPSRIIPDDSQIHRDGSICDSHALHGNTFDAFLDLAVLAMARASEVKVRSDGVWNNLYHDVERARQSYHRTGSIPGIISKGAETRDNRSVPSH